MKTWLQCPQCHAIYFREATDNADCSTCGSISLKELTGRMLLRCKVCGTTQNQTIYKQMQNRNPIKCQKAMCNGQVKAISLDGLKQGEPGVSPSQPRPKVVSNRRTFKTASPDVPPEPSKENSARMELLGNLNQKIRQPPPPKAAVLPRFNAPKAKDHPGLQAGDFLPFLDDFVEILDKLGTGGMGAVWKGRIVKTNQLVAIKEYYYTRYHDPESQENRCEKYWIREQTLIEIQSKSQERNMKLIGSVKLDKFQIPEFYIIIEFIEGIPLEKWYLEHFKSLESLTISELRKLIKQILMPIARHMYFVHENGIVHRDLTVQNVMIVPNGDEVVPVVIDWGVAKQIGVEKMYNPRKPYYISSAPEATGIRNRGTPPEVMAGFEPISVSDVYMLGHIMYFLFSGGRYCGTAASHEDYVLHPGDYNPDLPADFNKMVEYMTQYEPADRMPNMYKVYEALEWLYNATEALEFPEKATAQYFLHCDYNDALIPLNTNVLIQIGRDELLKAGANHDYDGHLYNAIVPRENDQFQFELYIDKGFLFIRDMYSKMGTFLNNLTMPNQQVFNDVAIKGQSNVYIPLSDANLGKTTIEVPFVAPDGVTYRIPFRIIQKK
jgi:tRNA A-37 threonylcarbamoyl transferase component Bud32